MNNSSKLNNIRAWKNSTIESWYNWLEEINNTEKPSEIYYVATQKDESQVKELCNLFEKKYKQKIEYRFDKICYLKYSNQ